jgi:isopenicillin N synthase-like dioxygenase
MSALTPIALSRPLDQIADAIGGSFARWGFAVIQDHGIPPALLDRAWARSREFFALPDMVKRHYLVPGGKGARGYTAFGVERAKDARLSDLKEFWHVGRTLPPGDPLSRVMPPNVWPAEVPGFREDLSELYDAFEVAGRRTLQAIALHLGLARDWFEPAVENGDSVMRLLHYPPVENAEGRIRAEAHGDINAITLLLGAEEAGLQLLTRDGEWIDIDPPPGALVVNIGDMLERQTNGRLPSTLHRVVNPVGEAARRARYSMPFFLHFRPDFLITPFEQCLDREHPETNMTPITAHDFLQQRLREINLG